MFAHLTFAQRAELLHESSCI